MPDDLIHSSALAISLSISLSISLATLDLSTNRLGLSLVAIPMSTAKLERIFARVLWETPPRMAAITVLGKCSLFC